eukprot:6228733-Prymnesium_polylepis.1
MRDAPEARPVVMRLIASARPRRIEPWLSGLSGAVRRCQALSGAVRATGIYGSNGCCQAAVRLLPGLSG